jgi:formylglycine-generating enzyme required for sulfatase activity/tetratricopeptide (TPR) repeat protein
MNDSLSELIKIAKTPAQTVAYEQYEIGRNAFRQGLYPECLEALEKAIDGDHTSPGYKLEWRFYQMKGVLYLGFEGCDLSNVDLEKAEAVFLLAARYARKNYPKHAALALLSAGWAAYCQGKMKEALAHTEEALSLHHRLGEAFFQAAKVLMATGEVKKALPFLGKAIELDRFYTLKAAGDGDFKKHEERLRAFIEALREEKYRQGVAKVRAGLEKLRFFCKHSPEAKRDNDLELMEAVLSEGEKWPLYDLLSITQSLNVKFSKIQSRYKDKIIVVTKNTSEVPRSFQETGPTEESYQEVVVVKSGWLFRRAIKEVQTKTRKVIKTRTVTRKLDDIRSDIYSIYGELMTSIEFCRIPAGNFMMGEKGYQHPVTLTRDFYIGKYPITQAQWEAVMGKNPSNFKGDPNLPVESVSWEDCQRFINKLNTAAGKEICCLPTEAQWEYSCRAGSTAQYCFGDDEKHLKQYAWIDINSGLRTHSVGQKQPNVWGLYDMHGNVWEWCSDWYEKYSSGSVSDPTGPSSGSLRVLRGGSWSNYVWYCRSANRGSRTPSSRRNLIGFRLVLPQVK